MLRRRLFVISLSGLAALHLCASEPDTVSVARRHALAYVNTHATKWGIDPASDLREKSASNDAKYDVVDFEYEQFFRGIPVLWSGLVLHVRGNGEVRAGNSLRGHVALATIKPKVSEDDAVALAIRHQHITGTADTKALLAILARHSLDQKPSEDRLVWQIDVGTANDVDPPTSARLVIDAIDGTVWTSIDLMKHATLTNASPYFYGAYNDPGDQLSAVGVRCSKNCTSVWSSVWLQDPCWGLGHVVTPFGASLNSGLQCSSNTTTYPAEDGGNWVGDAQNSTTTKGTEWKHDGTTGIFIGDGLVGSSKVETRAADAYRALKLTFDYIYVIHGRQGLNNSNGPMIRVLVRSLRTSNGGWEQQYNAIFLADGDFENFPWVSFDVVAHEIGHALDTYGPAMVANTQCTETNKIEEGTADMFAMQASSYLEERGAVPTMIAEHVKRANWNNQTFLQPPTQAARYLDDPTHNGSPACYYPRIGCDDPHSASAPASYAFYLMTYGGTSVCNGKQVSGVGMTTAQDLWRRMFFNHLTENGHSPGYAQLEQAFIAAAGDIAPGPSLLLQSVTDAFAAINL